jgi:hypothetical protein
VIKFSQNLVEEIKTANLKSQGILKNNIELRDRSHYFNQKALATTLEFALLSLQALNVIGLEDLLEEDSNIAGLIAPILGFNFQAVEAVMALEYKVEKFPQANKQSIDFVELAGKYYKVLPLFFWWVSSSSQENCDVGFVESADHRVRPLQKLLQQVPDHESRPAKQVLALLRLLCVGQVLQKDRPDRSAVQALLGLPDKGAGRIRRTQS